MEQLTPCEEQLAAPFSLPCSHASPYSYQTQYSRPQVVVEYGILEGAGSRAQVDENVSSFPLDGAITTAPLRKACILFSVILD